LLCGRPQGVWHRDGVRRRAPRRRRANPVLASSMLIRGYVRAPQGGLGLRRVSAGCGRP
jgi:hypothetical protein